MPTGTAERLLSVRKSGPRRAKLGREQPLAEPHGRPWTAVDTLWGIGLVSDDDADALDRPHGHGANWLGGTLTRLRDGLAAERRSGVSELEKRAARWGRLRHRRGRAGSPA